MSTAHTRRLRDFNTLRRLARIIGYRRSVWVSRTAITLKWQRFDMPIERLLKQAGISMPTKIAKMSGGPPPEVLERWTVEAPLVPDQKYIGIDVAHGPDQSGMVLGELKDDVLLITPIASTKVRKPSIDDFVTALTVFHIENNFRAINGDVVDRVKLCWLLSDQQRNELIEKVSTNLINEFRELEGI